MKCKRLKTLVFLLVLLLPASLLLAQETAGGMKNGEERIVKVLRTNNKAQVLKYVPRVYDFKNTNPHQVVNYFTSALATEDGGCYTFLAPDGNSGKLLVICPEHQIPYFDKIAKELDRSKITSSPGSKYIYYRLKHRSAADNNMLNILFNYGGELPVIAPPTAPNPGQALQADFATNALLLYDAPSGSENALKALEEILDKPTPQVEVQLKIYEVQVNNDGTMGLDYMDWKNGPGALLLNGEFGGENFKGNHIRYNNQWSRTGGYYIDYPSAYFDFLVVKSKAKVVSENAVATMSGFPAMLTAREQHLYFSKRYPEQPYVAGRPYPAGQPFPAAPTELLKTGIDDLPRYNREIDMAANVYPVNVGTVLSVVPTVGEENVELDLYFSVDNVTGYANHSYVDSRNELHSINDYPIVNHREFTDRVNVPLGQEVVITGFMRDRVQKHTQKVPILGSLPIIGWVFGGENPRNDKTMVVAVVKPVEINDMKNYSDECQMVASKAEGEAPISLPELKVGFDQWLLDQEK